MITTINEYRKILELGEANVEPYKFDLVKNTDTIYIAYFSTDKHIYKVYTHLNKSTMSTDQTLSVGFKVEEGEIETKENKQYAVMATIIAIIKEILRLEPLINVIEFEGTYKDNEPKYNYENQRIKFYAQYASKHLGKDWEMNVRPMVSTITLRKKQTDNDNDDQRIQKNI